MKTIKVISTLKINGNTSVVIDAKTTSIKHGTIIYDDKGTPHSVASADISNHLDKTVLLINGQFNSSTIQLQ